MMATRPRRAARVAFVYRKARQFRASFFFPREENILAGNEAAAVVTFSPPAIYYRSPDKSLQPIRFIWAYHPAGIFYQLPSYDPFAAPPPHTPLFFFGASQLLRWHTPPTTSTPGGHSPCGTFLCSVLPSSRYLKGPMTGHRFHIFILRRRCWCHGFTRLFIPKPTHTQTHTNTHTELGPC